jgi:hypothetical protein
LNEHQKRAPTADGYILLDWTRLLILITLKKWASAVCLITKCYMAAAASTAAHTQTSIMFRKSDKSIRMIVFVVIVFL